MRIIRQSSLAPLRGKIIAVIGYGSQGRAQALNLRDNGYKPVIGLPNTSRSRMRVRRDGLTVTTTEEAVASADIVLVLAPDHLHGVVYDKSIKSNLRAGQTLVFAHGLSVHFGLIKPLAEVDVIMIAPLGPGKRLRDLRGRKDGVACFIAVQQNPSGQARKLGLALAKAVGCLPAGAIETSFATEAVGDLFGEQAVLCGGLTALMQAGVDTLVQYGIRPEIAYLECMYQIDLIVDLIKSEGMAGMFSQISPTAAYGASLAGPKIVTPDVRRAMNGIYKTIADGQFLRRWLTESSRKRTLKAPKISAAYRKGETVVLRAFNTSKSKDS
jgi:ketol-acid reductoisomerase